MSQIPERAFIGQAELTRLDKQGDAGLKRAEIVARNNDVYMARGVRPSEEISIAREKARRAAEEKNAGENESENDMSKKTKGKKGTKETAVARKGGSLGDIFGFAVTAVIRTLGKEGVTIKQMQAILDAKKIKMPPASVSVQLGFGRNGSNRPNAELSKAQIAELVKLAPKDEAKPAKAAKKLAKMPNRSTTVRVPKSKEPEATEASNEAVPA
jgi:hypothetical protein